MSIQPKEETQKQPSRPSSVLLTDWGQNCERIGATRHIFLYELMLLSLIYEEILIQDHVLALSDTLANWFSPDPTLIENLINIGSIKVLTHPLHAYPEELANEAIRYPLTARSRYIEAYGTKYEKPYQATESQKKLCSILDNALTHNISAGRPCGKKGDMNLRSRYKSLLCKVLTNNIYANWIDSAFKGITPRIAEQILSFACEPEKAIAKLNSSGFNAKRLLDSSGHPVFTESLLFQISSMYHPAQADAIRRLSQTVSTALSCLREQAVGIYNSRLREFILEPEAASTSSFEKEPFVTAETHVNIPLGLPNLSSDFPKIIQKVRESKASLALRKSIQELGQQHTFTDQAEKWKAVAEELAMAVTKATKNVSVSIGRITGAGLSFGTALLANGLCGGPVPPVSPPLDWILNAFAGTALALVADPFWKAIARDLQFQRHRADIEKAVTFRCNWIQLPPSE
ncbi:MAG: hypothetical protein WAW37_00415 [Syntrophobacteraceae bacterium]